MSSLFKRLQSYRPRQERSPREDFFTEALCYILDKNREVLKEYIKFLLEKAFPNVDPIEKSIEIETQRAFKEGRPDVVITFADDAEQRYMIICEHKLDAEKDDQQLQRYSDMLTRYKEKGKIKDGILIFITLRHESPPDSVHYFRWRELYPLMKEWKELVTEPNKELYDEFLTYMEELEMAKPKKFTATELATFCRISGLLQSLDVCLNGKAWDEFKSIDGGNINHVNFQNYPMWLYWKSIFNDVELNMGICLDTEKWSDLFAFGDTDYPELVIFLSSPVKNKLRKKQLEFCRRFADSPPFISWEYIGKPEKTWMVIVHKSMREFIIFGDEQIDMIQEWFAEHLHELKDFIKLEQNPV